MTRRKINITLSIISIVLSFALFGFGVYASASVNSTINNTFKYDVPEDAFFVNMIGTISGSSNDGVFIQHNKNLPLTDYEDSYNVSFVEQSGGIYEDIVFTFKIENYNEYAITAEIIPDTSSSYFSSTPSPKITLGAYSWNGQNYVAQSSEISLVLKLTTNQNFQNETNGFTILFERV